MAWKSLNYRNTRIGKLIKDEYRKGVEAEKNTYSEVIRDIANTPFMWQVLKDYKRYEALTSEELKKPFEAMLSMFKYDYISKETGIEKKIISALARVGEIDNYDYRIGFSEYLALVVFCEKHNCKIDDPIGVYGGKLNKKFDSLTYSDEAYINCYIY